MRVGDRVFVAGTTAINAEGEIIGEGDPYQQTVQTLRTIEWALHEAGASMDEVVRYRVYAVRAEHIPDISRALAETFGGVRPVNTLVVVAALADPRMLVEIDADAIIGSAEPLQEGSA